VPADRRPSLDPSAIDRAKAALERTLGSSKVLGDPNALAAYAGDESGCEPRVPDVVVLAATPDDVATTLAIAERERVFVTPRGAGSGKSGGCVPVHGGIVLVTLGMAAIKEIDRDELVAVVEPGVVLGRLHEAVEREGLFYGPDANSLDWCAIGGNVAENAGGPRAFKHGVTRDWVLGLELVTMGGERVAMGRRTKKGVTGYDVTGLVVGSEGTLGVVTEVTLRLAPKPERVATLLALFTDVRAAARAVSRILEARVVPRCVELLDGPTLAAVRARGVAIDAAAGAMLLLEVDGADVAVEREVERVGAACDEAGALEVLAAQDAAARDRLWTARRELSLATRAMARFKLSEDVVVPRRKMADLLDCVDRIAEGEPFRALTYGHAGDGNLHVNFLWDDPAARPRVDSALEGLFRAVVALRGTLTGEHGVGLTKAPYLGLEQSDALVALQRRLKRAFDPDGLLNPGKIFTGSGHRSC
jgi:glycolate oxidase